MSTSENEVAPKSRIATLLRRIDLLLEEGKWQEALARCSDVLDIDPECADAYIAQLMAEVHAKNREGLGSVAQDYTDYQSYKNALRFSDEEHSNELKELSTSAASLYKAKRKRAKIAIVVAVICVVAVIAIVVVRVAIANDNPVQKARNAQIGDIVEYGSYEQDGDESNGAEPLEWIVLDRTEEGTLLVTKDIIDGKPFDEGSDGVARWDTSTLRTWLNGEFLDEAFTSEEKAALLQKHLYEQVENPYESGYYYPDLDVWDTVSLLLVTDITTNSEYRSMLFPVEATPYAHEAGVKDDEGWSNVPWWWTICISEESEPSFTQPCAWWTGHGEDYATWMGKNVILGVRPIIWVSSAEFSDSTK